MPRLVWGVFERSWAVSEALLDRFLLFVHLTLYLRLDSLRSVTDGYGGSAVYVSPLVNFESTWGLEKSHPEGSGDLFPVASSKPDGERCRLR